MGVKNTTSITDKLLTASYLAFNFFSVVAIVLSNKQLLVWKVPVNTLTLLHFIATEAFVFGCLKAGLFQMPEKPVTMTTTLWVTTIAKVGGNCASQYSLSWNSVGFFQLAKQMQVPAVLLLEFLMRGKTVSGTRLGLLVVVLVSVVYATVSDVQLNLKGALAGVANLLLAALEAVCLSSAQQQGEKLAPMVLMHTTMPWAILMTTALVPILEYPQVVALVSEGKPGEFFVMLVFSCSCAFFVNWSITLITGKASALTYSLLGQFKTVMILVMGWVLFDGHPTFKTVGGGASALIFLTVYSMATMREQDQEKREAAKAASLSLGTSDPAPRQDPSTLCCGLEGLCLGLFPSALARLNAGEGAGGPRVLASVVNEGGKGGKPAKVVVDIVTPEDPVPRSAAAAPPNAT